MIDIKISGKINPQFMLFPWISITYCFVKSAIVFNRKYYESPFHTYHDILKLNKQILIYVKTYFSDKGLQIIALEKAIIQFAF